jgi:hypothetical protein
VRGARRPRPAMTKSRTARWRKEAMSARSCGSARCVAELHPRLRVEGCGKPLQGMSGLAFSRCTAVALSCLATSSLWRPYGPSMLRIIRRPRRASAVHAGRLPPARDRPNAPASARSADPLGLLMGAARAGVVGADTIGVIKPPGQITAQRSPSGHADPRCRHMPCPPAIDDSGSARARFAYAACRTLV